MLRETDLFSFCKSSEIGTTEFRLGRFWGLGYKALLQVWVGVPSGHAEVGCKISVEIRNPWGKVMERSGLIFEQFCLEVVENRRIFFFFFADFALQNMLETTLPDGLETSGQRAYC